MTTAGDRGVACLQEGRIRNVDATPAVPVAVSAIFHPPLDGILLTPGFTFAAVWNVVAIQIDELTSADLAEVDDSVGVAVRIPLEGHLDR
jgi:hypothetical protein